MSDKTAYFPEQVPIDAYGNGGFRFAGGSHKGSLMFLPSGVYGWEVTSMQNIGAEQCWRILKEAKSADFVLMGTGDKQVFANGELSQVFDEAGLALEVMDTGAACRTYNLMMEEKRAVMAALISVE